MVVDCNRLGATASAIIGVMAQSAQSHEVRLNMMARPRGKGARVAYYADERDVDLGRDW
jgi:hypothetical protein